jgi:hypothetical protein
MILPCKVVCITLSVNGAELMGVDCGGAAITAVPPLLCSIKGQVCLIRSANEIMILSIWQDSFMEDSFRDGVSL